MNSYLIKTGSCSIVLGDFHYKNFIAKKPNKSNPASQNLWDFAKEADSRIRIILGS